MYSTTGHCTQTIFQMDFTTSQSISPLKNIILLYFNIFHPRMPLHMTTEKHLIPFYLHLPHLHHLSHPILPYLTGKKQHLIVFRPCSTYPDHIVYAIHPISLHLTTAKQNLIFFISLLFTVLGPHWRRI